MLNLNHQPMLFTVEDASSIARNLYDLHGTLDVLPGERDANFLLQTSSGQAFVLKVAPAYERKETLDLQNSALEYLSTHDPNLILPRVCRTAAGESIGTITTSQGKTHFVRLLTYVPGKPLARVRPHSPELLHMLGQLLGKMDDILQTFAHPAAHRELKWDLQQTVWIREYFQHIEQPARRAIVERFLSNFESNVLPILPSLRKSIIHGDANDYNVLIGDFQEDVLSQRSVSVIDFGDMVHSYTICNLAVAAAYAMLDKADPLAAAASIVAGYHEAFPLTEDELRVVYPLIKARLCISVVNSAYQQKIEPDNAYLMISEKPAWELLEKLENIHPRFAYYTFRHACHLSPCPDTPKVTNWLENNAGKFGRVVEPDLRTANSVIFDLSVGSRELGMLNEMADPEKIHRLIFERIKEAHAETGIGRYNEPRLIYTSDLFKTQGNDGLVWRTIHVGMDIFMEPGSPVFAPLDGIIHSFANNTAHLDYGPTIILQHTIEEEHLTFYTLYGHLSLDSLDGLYPGKPIAQGKAFAQIGEYAINGGWPPHLHFQVITDMLDKDGEFPGVALPSQRAVRLSLSPDPNLIVGIPRERFPQAGLTSEVILKEREKHIGKSLSISYSNPLKIVRGSMQYLYDDNGRAYLDAVNNVAHVGHNHPRVVKAGQAQMAVLNTNTRYLHDDLVLYAERICSTLPEALSVCYFVCSGSEANELALRLARTYTRSKETIVVDVAYHGNTSSLIEISPYKYDGPGGMGAPSFVHKVPMPDVYRGIYKRDDGQAGEKFARAVEESIREIQHNGGNTGTFICESLLSCGGQIVLPDGFLREAYRYIRNAGGVCIADEVQVGFGRVGTHFWGFETQGVIPDIVTMGKPIGNGHPLAAVVTTPEIAASFNNGMEYFNTFGGNPVSCAIGLAVLDVIENEHLQDNALQVGNHLLNGLLGLMEKYTLIGDVRGAGLFVGIELVLDRETLEPAPTQASYIANRMKECGILLSTDGPFHNVLKIKPPMVFSKENANFLIATLDEILQEDFLQI